MKNRKSLYRGALVDLGLETVTLPNRRTLDLEVVRHPGGAAVVAINDSHHVCLLRQYRHAAGGWLWELPAGKIDSSEDPAQTAQRELQEEAGLAARDWQYLGNFFSTPGFCDERVHLYLARELEQVAEAHHPDEVIEVHWMDIRQALDWLRDGTIMDGKTMIGLCLAREFL